MFFEESKKLKVLVVSAHPDDETFGAGGVLARHAKHGDEVYACIVTKAYEPDWSDKAISSIREQAAAAFKVLGIEKTRFLDFPTVKLNTVPGKELNDAIAAFVEETDPDIIYTPFPGDLNQDHQLVAKAASIAARPLPRRRRTVLFFEVLSSTEWGRVFLGSGFFPSVYVDISSTLEQKVEAASCYVDELKDFPHPRSIEGIRSLAKIRGMESGLQAAEAFVLAISVV